MADDDCSNCDKDGCKFRDISYNCQLEEIKDVQKYLTNTDIQNLQVILNSLLKAEEDACVNTFSSLIYAIENVIEMYSEEI